MPPTNPPRSISVLMPTWQGMEFLDRVIAGLRDQRCSVPWDVLVVDSGSTDGTPERLREHAEDFPVPLVVESIPSLEFDHGDTRNLLAAKSSGDLLVYLTQDAIPSRPDWLEVLLRNFSDPGVGAVTCGNVPRSDAWRTTRILSRDDPGYSTERRVTQLPDRETYDAMTPMERRLHYAFQNVAAAVRRDLWERFPFPRTMMGEDVLMARGLVEAGFALVLDPEASVDHSHDYGEEKLRWRGRVDGRFNAEWVDWVCVGAREDVPVLASRMVEEDLSTIPDPGERRALEPELRELRTALAEGLFEGGRSPKRYARSTILEAPDLSIVVLVPELPELPGAVAAPIRLRHALATARALLDRGHTVTVAAPIGGGDHVGQTMGVRSEVIDGLSGWRGLLARTRCQVVCVPVLWGDAGRWITAAIDAQIGVVATVDDPLELGDEESDLSLAVTACDRIVVTSPGAHGALSSRRLVDTDWLVHARRGVDAPDEEPRPPVAPPPGARAPIAAAGGDPVALRIEGVRSNVEVVPVDGLPPRDRADALARCERVVVLSTCPGERELWADEVRFHGATPIDRADLAAAGVDPDDARAVVAALASGGLVSGAAPHRAPRTLRDDVRELEFRLRGVAARDHDDALERAPLLSMRGDALPFTGPDIVQSGGARVIAPGASAAVPIAGVPPGPAWLIVRQIQLHVETRITLGGTAYIDGDPVGELAPSRAGREDEVRVDALPIWVPAGAHALNLVARPADPASGASQHLRIENVVISRRGPSSQGPVARPRPEEPGPSLTQVCRSLGEAPGRPVPSRKLPSVAVVIPTFDGLHDLEGAVESLLDVDYPRRKRQLVIVDNGSSDGTAAWLERRRRRLTAVPLARNVGFAAACNRGVEAAEGVDVIVFVNNDMRFEPDFLRELVAPIRRGECHATTAKRLSWDGAALDGAGVGSTFLGIAVQPDFGVPVTPAHEVHRRTLFACGGAMAIRRDVFLECGGFDEDFFAYYEDLDLGWRMWLHGFDVHYVPTAVCYHHHSATSRRFPPEVVRRMVIRNSVATCVKNYSDANLRRVLPALLGLAIERAYLKSDIDTDPFDPDRVSLAGEGGPPEPRRHSIDGIGAADLVALHDVLGRWSEWMAKREQVQARRVRTDRDVFAMFLDPLACVEGHSSYAELQADLVERLGIGDLFR